MTKLKQLAEEAIEQYPAWYPLDASGLSSLPISDRKFISAASPQAIITLEERIEELEKLRCWCGRPNEKTFFGEIKANAEEAYKEDDKFPT